MEPEFVNESMWDDDDDGTNNDDGTFGEDDSNMEMSGFGDGSATGDTSIAGATGEGGAVGDAQDIGKLMADTDEVRFIQTRAGHLQLIHGPYIFVADSVRSGRTFWRCMEYNRQCKARISSKNNVLRVKNADHNHHQDHLKKINAMYVNGKVVTCPTI